MDKKLSGLISAPYTAYHQDGSLNVEIISEYAAHLKSSGVQGVFVNGTTGEGVLLTLAERKMNIERWMDQQSESFKILVHVGHDSLATAKELATHAQDIGVDGIGVMGTAFFKPATVDALVSFNQEIAAAAADTPFYYYHIPSMTGVNFNMIDFIAEADGRIPNLAGIKFTDENLMDMKLCMAYENEKYTILHGRDEILICGLSLGVKGGIGSTYNYLGPLFTELISAFENGDYHKANQLQLDAIHIIQVLIKHGGGVRAGKSIMKLTGLDFGGNRAPIQSLNSEEETALFKELEEVNIRKYISTS